MFCKRHIVSGAVPQYHCFVDDAAVSGGKSFATTTTNTNNTNTNNTNSTNTNSSSSSSNDNGQQR
jgi:hypothetical protein